MVLGTTTEVEEIAFVKNDSGGKVPPRSDDFRHIYGDGVDVSGEGHVEEVQAPDRAQALVLHVDEFDAAVEVTVWFNDPDGNRLTSRDKDDNDAFATDGSTDIFVEVAIASPFVEIEISGSGSVNFNGYFR